MAKAALLIGMGMLVLFVAPDARGENFYQSVADCTSCFGGVYTLAGNLQSSSNGWETWRITYSLDLSGYVGDATYVSQLAAKVVPQSSDMISVSNRTTPTGDGWALKLGNVGNSGCTGINNGWVCLQWNSGDQLVVKTPRIYSWEFDITITAGKLIVPTLTTGPSIQANFDSPTGQFLSTKVMVPEAAGIELLLGVAGLGLIYRRKLARS